MAKAETAVETVTMDDKSLVEFAGKRKLLKTSTIDEANGTVSVRLDFRNGEFRVFTLPQALILRFAAHGAEQKLGDEVAGLKDKDGKPAEVEDMVFAIDSLMDRLEKGEWNVKRSSDGMAGTSILARALVEHSGKPLEVIRDYLKGKTHAEKIALRNSAKVKPIVDRLEAEKAERSASASPVDTDSMLDELEAA